MSTSAIIMMILILGGIWGGFVYLLLKLKNLPQQ